MASSVAVFLCECVRVHIYLRRWRREESASRGQVLLRGDEGARWLLWLWEQLCCASKYSFAATLILFIIFLNNRQCMNSDKQNITRTREKNDDTKLKWREAINIHTLIIILNTLDNNKYTLGCYNILYLCSLPKNSTEEEKVYVHICAYSLTLIHSYIYCTCTHTYVILVYSVCAVHIVRNTHNGQCISKKYKFKMPKGTNTNSLFLYLEFFNKTVTCTYWLYLYWNILKSLKRWLLTVPPS